MSFSNGLAHGSDRITRGPSQWRTTMPSLEIEIYPTATNA
jgi:hypothetical protein